MVKMVLSYHDGVNQFERILHVLQFLTKQLSSVFNHVDSMTYYTKKVKCLYILRCDCDNNNERCLFFIPLICQSLITTLFMCNFYGLPKTSCDLVFMF